MRNVLPTVVFALVIGGCQTTSTTSSNSSGHSSGSVTTSTQAEVWRKSVPKPGPEPQPTLPVFERAQLKNGLTVMVIQNRTLPLVSFRMVIRGGSREDPQQLPGLTAFSFGMLDEGAADGSEISLLSFDRDHSRHVPEKVREEADIHPMLGDAERLMPKLVERQIFQRHVRGLAHREDCRSLIVVVGTRRE